MWQYQTYRNPIKIFQMATINRLLCFITLSFSISGCNMPDSQKKEVIESVPAIDSINDAWFSCYINQQKWEKSDSLSASFSVKSDILFLSINCQYNSLTYKKISLLIPLGKVTKNTNKQLVNAVNDTLLALIIYSFAEIDYSTETPIPMNHMAFELKPTALVSITNVDTVKHSISGTFKAVAEDENKKKYAFGNGIFRNVIYKKL